GDRRSGQRRDDAAADRQGGRHRPGLRLLPRRRRPGRLARPHPASRRARSPRRDPRPAARHRGRHRAADRHHRPQVCGVGPALAQRLHENANETADRRAPSPGSPSHPPMTALMYHDVVAPGADDASGFPGRDAALYKVTPETFAAHLDAIARATGHVSERPSVDYRFCGAVMRERRGPGDPRDPIITFDDGGASAMTAADLLEAHGFIGHFFITANYVGAPGFVTERQLRELVQRG